MINANIKKKSGATETMQEENKVLVEATVVMKQEQIQKNEYQNIRIAGN